MKKLLGQLSLLKLDKDSDRFMKAIEKLPELMKRTVIAMASAGGEGGYFNKMLEDMGGELEGTIRKMNNLLKVLHQPCKDLETHYNHIGRMFETILTKLISIVNDFLDSEDAIEEF